jgi:hypothetical protein
MTSLLDRIPEPTSSWTQDHDPNPLEGTVIARRDIHSAKFDKDFSVLEVEEANGTVHEIPCGRSDLGAFVRRFDPQQGDRIALRYWGQQGMRHTYTGVAVRDRQTRLQVADPTEQTPALTDDDYIPDEEAGA